MNEWNNTRWYVKYEIGNDLTGIVLDMDEVEQTSFNSLNQLRMLMDDEESYRAFLTQG